MAKFFTLFSSSLLCSEEEDNEDNKDDEEDEDKEKKDFCLEKCFKWRNIPACQIVPPLTLHSYQTNRIIKNNMLL